MQMPSDTEFCLSLAILCRLAGRYIARAALPQYHSLVRPRQNLAAGSQGLWYPQSHLVQGK